MSDCVEAQSAGTHLLESERPVGFSDFDYTDKSIFQAAITANDRGAPHADMLPKDRGGGGGGWFA